MSRFTRRFKKNKNKTIKSKVSSINPPVSTIKIGGNYGEIQTPNEISKTEEQQREGIIDNNLSQATSGLISNAENAVDKTGSVMINDVNEVLGSEAVKETTKQAAKDTVDIVKELAGTFNEALDDPEFKSEAKQAIKNAGELGVVLADAAKEPLDRALNSTAESIGKTMPKLGAAGVKTLWDAIGAFPPLNILIEGINVVNDVTKAASAVTEATTETIESASDAFIETKKNVETKLKELEEKKRISQQISNRTTNSINEFESPINTQSAGGYKTRRRLFKNKAKSKRVRFSI